MHPLPRVEELDIGLDSDRRAVYFQQASYGVPIRMALITMLLGIKKKPLQQYPDGFAEPRYPVYHKPIGIGLSCINGNCISCDPAEQRYAANKFYIVPSGNSCRLRCVYCETDIEDEVAKDFVVTDTGRQHYVHGIDSLTHASEERLRHLTIHASEADAEKDGHRARPTGRVARAN
jgi:hypothetical protein